MILSNIKQHLLRNKRLFLSISSFFVISFLMGDVTFAAEGDMAKNTVEFFNGLLKGVSVLLGLMTYLSTMFLSPEWINGSLFGMNVKFKEVWIMVSNIVYFIFAFILIWIAFMNIIGKNTNQYQLKQALPKFIVGVIIVPFSWFFVQLVLSISAILTVSALTLPADSFPDYTNMLQTVEVPRECKIDISSLTSGKDKDTGGDFVVCGETGGSVKLSDLMTGGGTATQSIYGVMSMYTYGIIGFDNVDNITMEDSSALKKIGDVIVKIVFDFLFVLVYSILIIALGLVLMIRGIYIWIYTMMSPIFGLMYFFDKKDGGDGFFAKFNVKEFIALAMVPVYTMLALSFGLLFMYVVGSGISGSATSAIGGQTVKVESGEKDGTIIIGDGNSSVSLKIIGAVSSKSTDASNLMNSIGGGALGVVGSLILKLFGIVVLWGTVMAAMSASKITEAVIKPLQDFGSKVGQIASSAPGNVPIFGGQSMKSMGNIANAAQSSITTINNDRSQSFLDKHGLFGGGKSSSELRKLEAIIKSTNNDPKKQVAAMHKIFEAVDGDTKKLYTDPEAQKRLLELAKQMKVDIPADIKSATDINSPKRLEDLFNAIEKTNPSQFAGVIKGAEYGKINYAYIDEQVKANKGGNGTASTSDNNGLKKGTSSEKFADFSIGTKDIRVTINSDGTRQINVNNGAKNLGRLLVEGYTFEQLREVLADMGIDSDLEIKKTYEQIIKSGLYYDKKNKKYSITDVGGDYKKINDVDEFISE